MMNALKEFCHTIGIEYVGIVGPGPYHDLEQIWKERLDQGHITGFEEKDFARRLDARLTLEDAQSVIVCLFPYFSGANDDANLTKSAFSLDYHIIVRDKLELIGRYLQDKIDGFHYKAFVDNGPLVDRYLAYQAGLGFFGINAHIITDKYGSYVFIGYIINNQPFVPDKPLDRTCIQCGLCVRACPGCAILGNFDINPLRCRSYITQKKDELSEQDIDTLQKHHLVYGCDICQDVCPHNKDIDKTGMEEFSSNIKSSIDYDELMSTSNKEFLRRYRDRTFSWRGRKLLLRNFDLIRESTAKNDGCRKAKQNLPD